MKGTRHRKLALGWAVLASLVGAVLAPGLVEAITVGPVKLEYSVDPGTVVTGEIFIKNEEGIPRTLYPSVDQFTEQEGQKIFIKEQGRVGEWFQTVDSVTLEPDEGRKIPFTFNVPENAPPGGAFGVIWWSTSPPVAAAGAQDVSIQTRAGILVYINVSGDITEAATIENFDTSESRAFFWKASVPFDLRIANKGNVYIKPEGSLKVRSVFGWTTAEVPLNAKGLQILPQSSRSFGDVVWDGSWMTFGPYKVTANVAYGAGNLQEVSASRWVWVFPIKLILVVAVSAVALAVCLTMFFRFYNRWLLRKYARNG